MEILDTIQNKHTEKEFRAMLCFKKSLHFNYIQGIWFVNIGRYSFYSHDKQWNKLVNDIIKAKVESNRLNIVNYGRPLYDIHIAYIGNISNMEF